MSGLFQRRRRDAAKAESSVKLAEAISPKARGQIAHALTDHALPNTGESFGAWGTSDWAVLNDAILRIVVREWGAPNVSDPDVRNVVLRATDAEVLDIVEAWFPATALIVETLDQASMEMWAGGSVVARARDRLAVGYRARINDIFDDRDVAWHLAGTSIVPRSSAAMHREVIEPVFALTGANPRLAGVERAFQKALIELKPDGDPADAITDASTALQEMLESAGAKGNALGPLLKDARKRELLGPYDSKLAEAVELLGDWVSADRSERGDAHHSREATRDDAWLTVRVVGALILRLGAGRKR